MDNVLRSEAMKRNRDAVASGRVKLFLGSVSELPAFDILFGKVLDINSFQFWDKPVEYLTKLRENIAKGGIIAIVHERRKPGATMMMPIPSLISSGYLHRLSSRTLTLFRSTLTDDCSIFYIVSHPGSFDTISAITASSSRHNSLPSSDRNKLHLQIGFHRISHCMCRAASSHQPASPLPSQVHHRFSM